MKIIIFSSFFKVHLLKVEFLLFSWQMSDQFIMHVQKILEALSLEGPNHAEPALETLNAMFLAFQEDVRLLDDDVRENQRDDLLEAHRVFYSAGLTIIEQIVQIEDDASTGINDEVEIEQPEQIKDIEMSSADESQNSVGVEQMVSETQPPTENNEQISLAEASLNQSSTSDVQQQVENEEPIPVVQVSFNQLGAWGGAELSQPSVSSNDESKSVQSQELAAPRMVKLSEMCAPVTNDWPQLSYLDYENLMRPLFMLRPLERVDERALNEILVAISAIRERALVLHFSLDREWRWIIAFIQSRMDEISRSLWVWQMDRKEPTLDDLLHFIIKRSNRLEPHERSAARSAQPSTSRAAQPSTSRASSTGGGAVPKSKKTKTVCVDCGGDHFLHKCEVFRAHTMKQKRLVLETNRLCHNCFSSAHLTGACSQGVCKRCQAKHNSLLCPKAPKDKDKGEK